MAVDRSAALLIRVWLEDGADHFRARLTAVGPDSPAEDQTIAVTASTGDVLEAVRGWLEEFLRSADAQG